MNETNSKIRKWMIITGVAQITFGCIVGMIPPTAVAWFRGIVMAHIEYTANGVMLVVFGFLVNELKLGPRALKTWFAMLQIGTWMNGSAGLLAGIIGSSSELLPTLNEKFPAPNGMNHPIVSGMLRTCAVTIMIGLFMTLWGLLANRQVLEKKLTQGRSG